MEEMEDHRLIQIDDKTIVLRTSNPSEVPRLTPTGKISYAKTRVYTQRYRKEWEQSSDFRAWLSSVPHEPTRAYCKFCKKDLHAHRLSLLKHMCTMKHQRSALLYQNDLVLQKRDENVKGVMMEAEFENSEEFEEVEAPEEDIEYAMDDTEELEESCFPEHKYARNIKEENNDLKTRLKSIKVEQGEKRDKLAEAMAHVHGEVAEVEHIQLDMDVVSETVETTEFEDINEPLSDGQNLSFDSLNSEEITAINEDESSENEELNEEIEFMNTTLLKTPEVKKMTVPVGNTLSLRSNQGKTILLSNGSKAVTLTPGKLTPATQYLLNKFKSPQKEASSKSTETSPQQVASTSQAKKMTKVSKSPLTVKKPTISTHVLDMTKGVPIAGLQVSLYKLLDGRWTFVNECNTSSGGHCSDLISSEKNALMNGRYKLHFDVDKYFSIRKIDSLFPFIEVVFDVKNPVISYHIPILLSPFGYTIYRGMDR